MNMLIALFNKCKKSQSVFLLVLARFLFIKIFFNKTMLLHQKVSIRGLRNINVKDQLQVGLNYVGFMHRTDKTYLNIKGKLIINGKYSIGRGCRIDIAPNALVNIGQGGYINCNSIVSIMHSLTIGNECAISWNCQFLDDDLHQLNYQEKAEISNNIIIGNKVWIGCNVKIYKGTVIPDGCVIASDSVVKGIFTIPNCLIGGVPARVIKNDVDWV